MALEMHPFWTISFDLFPKTKGLGKIWQFHAMQQTFFLRKSSTKVVSHVLFSIQKQNSLVKRALPTVVVRRVKRLCYAERQWIAGRRWLPLSTPRVLPNYFASVLKTKRDLPPSLMISDGKMSVASRGMVRFSPRPLVLEINWKISSKMGAFRVSFPIWSLFKHI